MTQAQRKVSWAPNVRHSMTDLVRSLDRHMHEHRYNLANPVAVRINTGVEFPVFIELSCGGLHQVCAGMLTWHESMEGGVFAGRRVPDGGTVVLELTGTTVDGVALHVTDAVQWVPGLLPSLAAGDRMQLGTMLIGALARGAEVPDREYPPALGCLLDTPEDVEGDQ